MLAELGSREESIISHPLPARPLKPKGKSTFWGGRGARKKGVVAENDLGGTPGLEAFW